MEKGLSFLKGWEGEEPSFRAWDDNSQPPRYQSRLPIIDQILNHQTSEYASKVRHGELYRSVVKLVRSQTGVADQGESDWLRNTEMDLWSTISKDPFPASLHTIWYHDCAWDPTGKQTYTKNSTARGTSVGPVDEKGNPLQHHVSNLGLGNGRNDFQGPDDGRVFGRADTQTQGYVSSSDSDGGVKLGVEGSKNDTIGGPREDIALNSFGDTKALAGKHTMEYGFDGLSVVIDGDLADAVKNAEISMGLPRSTINRFHNNMIDDGAPRSDRPAHMPQAKVPKSAMPHTVLRRSHVLSSSSNTNSYEIRERTTLMPQRLRGNERASHPSTSTSNDGWVEFRDPRIPQAQTSAPVVSPAWDSQSSRKLFEAPKADVDTKRAAALASWAAFPAQAALEDKANEIAYKNRVHGESTRAPPVIKETYKKVVVSGDTFQRKIVEKSFTILE